MSEPTHISRENKSEATLGSEASNQQPSQQQEDASNPKTSLEIPPIATTSSNRSSTSGNNKYIMNTSASFKGRRASGSEIGIQNLFDSMRGGGSNSLDASQTLSKHASAISVSIEDQILRSKVIDFLEKDGDIYKLLDPDYQKNISSFYDPQNHDKLVTDHQHLVTILSALHLPMNTRKIAYQSEKKKRITAEELYKDLKIQVQSYESQLSQEIAKSQKYENQISEIQKRYSELVDNISVILPDKMDLGPLVKAVKALLAASPPASDETFATEEEKNQINQTIARLTRLQDIFVSTLGVNSGTSRLEGSEMNNNLGVGGALSVFGGGGNSFEQLPLKGASSSATFATIVQQSETSVQGIYHASSVAAPASPSSEETSNNSSKDVTRASSIVALRSSTKTATEKINTVSEDQEESEKAEKSDSFQAHQALQAHTPLASPATSTKKEEKREDDNKKKGLKARDSLFRSIKLLKKKSQENLYTPTYNANGKGAADSSATSSNASSSPSTAQFGGGKQLGALSHCIPHKFETHKVFAPVKCQLCTHMIWSGSTIHKCVYCKYNAHPHCYLSVPPNCGMKDLSDLLKLSLSPNGAPGANSSQGSLGNGNSKMMRQSSSATSRSSEYSRLGSSDTASQSGMNQVFGQKLEELAKHEKTLIPFVITSCLKAIEEYGIKEQGIYRVPGKKADVDRLKMHFNYGRPNITLEAKTDINTIAGVIKLYFRELPQPLLTYDCQTALIRIVEDGSLSIEQQYSSIKDSLKAFLPDSHYASLKRLIYHFTMIASNSELNKMFPSNLAVVFGPTIMRPKDDSDLFQMSHQCSIVEMLIKRYNYFFEDGKFEDFAHDVLKNSEVYLAQDQVDPKLIEEGSEQQQFQDNANSNSKDDINNNVNSSSKFDPVILKVQSPEDEATNE